MLALDNINRALGLALGPNSMLGHSYLFELGPAFGASRFWMEVDGSAVQTGSQLQVTKDWRWIFYVLLWILRKQEYHLHKMSNILNIF